VNPRRIAAAIGLPIASVLQATAWYAGRSMVFRHASEILGMSVESLHLAMSFTTIGGVAGACSAVVVTMIAGPGAAATSGLILSAVGTVLYAVLPAQAFASAALIAGFGHSMFAAAIFATAAIAFGRGHEGARNALIASLYVGTNLGAMVTAFLPQDTAWSVAVFVASGVGLGVAAAIVGAVAILDWKFAADPANADTSDAFDPKALALSLAIGAVGAVVLVAWSAGVELDARAMYTYSDWSPWLDFVNPGVVGFVGSVVIAGWVVAQIARVPIPGLGVAGLGAILASAAIGSGVLPQFELRTTLAPIVAATVVGAVGEVLLLPALYARAAGDVHWRASTAASAMLTVGMSVAGLLSGPLGDSDLRLIAQGAAAIVCGALGAVLIAASLPLQLTLFAMPDGGKLGQGVHRE
jgi:hypothetical protein